MGYIRDNDLGATAVEYALMVALITVAIITTVTALGISLNDLFNHPVLQNALSN